MCFYLRNDIIKQPIQISTLEVVVIEVLSIKSLNRNLLFGRRFNVSLKKQSSKIGKNVQYSGIVFHFSCFFL